MQNGKVLDELVAFERALISAYVTHDRGVLERLLAPEYIHTNYVGGRTTKRQEIDEFYTPGRFKLTSGDIANPTVQVLDGSAVLWADLIWRGATYAPPGRDPIDLSGTYAITRTYRHSAQGWLAVASHASRKPRA